MVIDVTWSAFKALVVEKKKVRYVETDSYYTLSYQDRVAVFECSVLKDSGSNQTDFEANFKPYANQPVDEPITPDARTLLAVNRIPPGYTIYPTGRADHITNGTYGNGTRLKLDVNTQSADFQMLNHWYGIGGKLIWENATIDDEANGTLIAPATTGATQTAGNYNKYEVISGSGLYMFIPATPGQGAWSLDLTAKLTNTQILKCVPVPATGNNGFFDYNSDTNVLTVNTAQTGGYNLYDFPVNLFKFGNCIYGRAQNGSESAIEASNVVGKLLYNCWIVRFVLTPVTSGVRMGIVLTTAVKKNI